MHSGGLRSVNNDGHSRLDSRLRNFKLLLGNCGLLDLVRMMMVVVMMLRVGFLAVLLKLM